ncbi:anti-sigma factor [Paenibacillus sediminis]|uniref:Regulator of SigK n=1 Tax=Paenibacillus sediminis TaxID=664909 RepID=A0ABS4H0L4_9BACL|nr:anti-sigma factor [Paenibacillus sediminis]MBP1936077.1 hypothetical protein [Paenibacillus sediminis]
MSNSKLPECDLMLDVLTGECTEIERLQFERHLHYCHSCRQEWDDFREIWEVLPMDMDEIAVPNDLKQEVMSNIFRPESVQHQMYSNRKTFVFTKVWKSPIFYASMTVVVLLLLGAWKWDALHAGYLTGNRSTLHIPMKEIEDFPMYSFSSNMPDVKGNVSLVSQGQTKKLIITMNGLHPTTGKNVYQVWLLHGDERYNCGTFRVSSDGRGVLIYQLLDPDVQIDGFGITLEPDSNGSKPRGIKVAGTKPKQV